MTNKPVIIDHLCMLKERPLLRGLDTEKVYNEMDDWLSNWASKSVQDMLVETVNMQISARESKWALDHGASCENCCKCLFCKKSLDTTAPIYYSECWQPKLVNINNIW